MAAMGENKKDGWVDETNSWAKHGVRRKEMREILERNETLGISRGRGESLKERVQINSPKITLGKRRKD